jgi:hypothetical protein
MYVFINHTHSPATFAFSGSSRLPSVDWKRVSPFPFRILRLCPQLRPCDRPMLIMFARRCPFESPGSHKFAASASNQRIADCCLPTCQTNCLTDKLTNELPTDATPGALSELWCDTFGVEKVSRSVCCHQTCVFRNTQLAFLLLLILLLSMLLLQLRMSKSRSCSWSSH